MFALVAGIETTQFIFGMIRILLIEDDRWLADSYLETLSEYEVDTAIDAEHAVALIDANEYDVIIADVMLERNLVFDLLHELQSYDDTAALPIILCTNLADRLSLDDVKEYGVVEILNKAYVTPKLLKETVENVAQ